MTEEMRKMGGIPATENSDWGWFHLTIGKKLISTFLLLSLIPIAVIGFMSYYSASNLLKKQALMSLEAIADSRISHITHLIQLRLEQAKELAGTYLPRQMESEGVNDPEDIAKIQEHIESILSEMKLPSKAGYGDIDKVTAIEIIGVLDREGIIVADTDKKLIGEKIPDEYLSRVKTRRTFFGGYQTDPLTGRDYLILLQAIRDFEDNNFAGAALFKIRADVLNDIVGVREGLGKTGEILIAQRAGDKVKFITRLHHTNSPPVITLGSASALPVQSAVQGNSGRGVSVDYRNEEVLSVWKYFPSMEWGIVAKIDTEEAFAPAVSLGIRVIWIFCIIVAVVTISAYFVSKTISNPIETVSSLAVRVGNGDLTLDIASDRSDEIGVLTRAFGKMIKDLREQMRDIMDGVNVLAAATGQIMATISQLTTSSEEAAVSVSQTITTVEEVKQTAVLASEKAKNVSADAQEAVNASLLGEKAVEKTVEGMNRINEQVASISGSIVTLSEHSHAIEDIISSVDDLSEQSNLLAVNASIEAARAGEEGKGFAVVAREVKNLSDQSKEATAKVRTILNDIQKAINNVGIAAELGRKVADAGVIQSGEAGESIRKMAESIEKSANAMTQIAVSSKQQLVGVSQTLTAMDSIRQASAQNVEGSRQLETGARDLDELGKKLKQMVKQYKI